MLHKSVLSFFPNSFCLPWLCFNHDHHKTCTKAQPIHWIISSIIPSWSIFLSNSAPPQIHHYDTNVIRAFPSQGEASEQSSRKGTPWCIQCSSSPFIFTLRCSSSIIGIHSRSTGCWSSFTKTLTCYLASQLTWQNIPQSIASDY